MAMIFLVYVVILVPKMIKMKFESRFIFFKVVDLLTTAIPPSLPAVLTSCTLFSMEWLKKRQIFCISPTRIPVCGRVSAVVFDKTGTLTADGLNFKGCRAARNADNQLIVAMATCHSLSSLKESSQLVGDPMDIEIFTHASENFAEVIMDESNAIT